MKKRALDIQELLRQAGTGITRGAGQATDSISNWYSGLEPATQKAVMRGLVGAGVGGGITGGITAMTPRDPGEKSNVLRNAIWGALLGGGAAAAVPQGLDMLKGDFRLESEPKRSYLNQLKDRFLVNPAVRSPIGTAGIGYGVHKGIKDWDSIATDWRNSGKGGTGFGADPRTRGFKKRVSNMQRGGGRRSAMLAAGSIIGGPLLQKIYNQSGGF